MWTWEFLRLTWRGGEFFSDHRSWSSSSPGPWGFPDCFWGIHGMLDVFVVIDSSNGSFYCLMTRSTLAFLLVLVLLKQDDIIGSCAISNEFKSAAKKTQLIERKLQLLRFFVRMYHIFFGWIWRESTEREVDLQSMIIAIEESGGIGSLSCFTHGSCNGFHWCRKVTSPRRETPCWNYIPPKKTCPRFKIHNRIRCSKV